MVTQASSALIRLSFFFLFQLCNNNNNNNNFLFCVYSKSGCTHIHTRYKVFLNKRVLTWSKMVIPNSNLNWLPHLLVPVFLLIILAFPQLAWNVLDIIIIIIIQVSSIISKVRSDLFPPSPLQCLQVPHQQQRIR